MTVHKDVNLLFQKKAEKVLSCHYQSVKHSITDNIVPEKVLKARLKASNIELSEQEFEIVICQLRKDRLLSVHLSENGEKVESYTLHCSTRVLPNPLKKMNLEYSVRRS